MLLDLEQNDSPTLYMFCSFMKNGISGYVYIAAWLSYNKRAEVWTLIIKFVIEEESHTNSQDVNANALYSTSTDDLETILHFLDFKETKESPKNT